MPAFEYEHNNEPEFVEKTSWWDATKNWARKHPILALTLGIFFLGVIGVLIGSGVGLGGAGAGFIAMGGGAGLTGTAPFGLGALSAGAIGTTWATAVAVGAAVVEIFAGSFIVALGLYGLKKCRDRHNHGEPEDVPAVSEVSEVSEVSNASGKASAFDLKREWKKLLKPQTAPKVPEVGIKQGEITHYFDATHNEPIDPDKTPSFKDWLLSRLPWEQRSARLPPQGEGGRRPDGGIRDNNLSKNWRK